MMKILNASQLKIITVLNIHNSLGMLSLNSIAITKSIRQKIWHAIPKLLILLFSYLWPIGITLKICEKKYVSHID